MHIVANSDEQQLSFSAPMIGPKTYIVRGPSGWPETIDRAKADAELKAFAGVTTIANLVDIFIDHKAVHRTMTDWWSIVGFLGRTLKVAPMNVPPTAAISFWAHVRDASSSK